MNPSTISADRPTPPTVIEPASQPGRLADPAVAPRRDDNADHLDGADHHQQVAHEVDQRQQPWVPQQADDRQAVARQVDEGDGGQTDDAEGDAVGVATGDAGDEPDHGQRRDEDVERRGEREEHVPERVVGTLRSGAVLHVRHVLVVADERADPERRQEHDGETDGEAVPQAAPAVDVDERR